LNKGRINEFVGDVKITSDDFIVTSDKAVSDKKTGIIEATDNVYIKYSSDTWNVEGWCDEVKIFPDKNIFIMTGSVKTVYRQANSDTNEEDQAEVFSDSVKFDYSPEQEAFFNGNVKVIKEKMEVVSREAFYSKKSGMIEFKGEPKAVNRSDEFRSECRGDIIRFFMGEEKVDIKGRAHTRIYSKDDFKM
jgi:lipopolysaccharide export system protein LptA